MKHLSIWSIAAVLTIMAAGAGAGNVSIGLNFYTAGDGDIVRAGKLPDGVTVMPKKKFDNPKLKGFCRYVVIDLDKCTSVDMKFVVSGKGQIFPSVSAWKGKIGASKSLSVKCTKFEFNDEVCAPKPFVFSKYKRMAPNNGFEDGDVITLKADFSPEQ